MSIDLAKEKIEAAIESLPDSSGIGECIDSLKIVVVNGRYVVKDSPEEAAAAADTVADLAPLGPNRR